MVFDGIWPSFFNLNLLDCWILRVKTDVRWNQQTSTLISQLAFQSPSQFKIGMNYANLLPQQQRITKLMTENKLKK